MTGAYPQPRPDGADSGEAVELCAEWLSFLGDPDVTVAPAGAGFDISSCTSIAWVNNRFGNVDYDYVLTASEVAREDGRLPLIFFRGGFAPEAQDLATNRGFGLLRYDAAGRRLSGQNRLGRRLRAAAT